MDLPALIESQFDAEIPVAGAGDVVLHRTVFAPKSATKRIRTSLYTSFAHMIDVSLGELYRENDLSWKLNKVKEFEKFPIYHVFYTAAPRPQSPQSVPTPGEVKALVSFWLVDPDLEDDVEFHELYLYEIHVAPEFQQHSVGRRLLRCFHGLGTQLQPRYPDLAYTKLTVFRKNAVALQWYFKNGYEYAPESPRDTDSVHSLPMFYILQRRL